MGIRKRNKQPKLLAPVAADRHERYLQRRRRMTPLSNNPSFAALVKRAVWFQFSLAADGVRDLLLSPISILAAILGLFRPDNPSWAFDRVMMIGRATDRWINLFEQENETPEEERIRTIDDLFDQFEQEVKTRLDPELASDNATWAEYFETFRAKRPTL